MHEDVDEDVHEDVHEVRPATAVNTSGTADRGFSVVESVIVIALLGILFIPVLNAVQTLILASSVSRSAARVETAIVNATDRVIRAPKSCDYTIYVQAAVLIEGWPADSASVTHEYLVSGATDSDPAEWSTGGPGAPACPLSRTFDGLVQRMTISISSPDGRIQRSIQVVKSDV